MISRGRGFLFLALSVLFLGPAAPSFGADSIVCADDDDNGVVDIVKTAGLPDRDCDGELSVADGGNDCDDTDRWIRDGLTTYAAYEAAKGVCTSSQYRTCTGGTLSACTSAQLCERSTCYYVDTDSGSDSNGCTWAAPCATFAKLTSGGSITVGADTAIYLMGSADLTVASARTPDGGDGSAFIVFETEAAGTSSATKNIFARYPTSSAKISVGGASYCDGSPSLTADRCTGAKLSHSYWEVRGFEFSNYQGSGVWSIAGDNVFVHNNYMHDLTGVAANNQSCATFCDGCDNIVLSNNIINDCYDPAKTGAPGCGDTTCDRQNVCNVTFFGNSQNQNALYNSVGSSTAYGSNWHKLSRGIRWKHGNAPADMTVENLAQGNIIYRSVDRGISTNGAKTSVRGNLLIDIAGRAFGLTDEAGGDGYFIDGVNFINNTARTIDALTTQSATGYSIANGETLTSLPISAVYLTNNIIVDQNATCGSTENLMVNVFAYGNDTLYASIITGSKLNVNNNCWYNSNVSGLTDCFNVFGEDGPGTDGELVNFANWQSTYGFDVNGYNENPLLSAEQFRATSTNCTGKGWEAEWPTPSTGGSGGNIKLGGLRLKGRK